MHFKWDSRVSRHSLSKNPVLGNATPVLGVKPKRGLRILVIFKNRPMFSHHSKGLGESFSLTWLDEHRSIPKYALPSVWFHDRSRYSIPQNGSFVFTVMCSSYFDPVFSAINETILNRVRHHQICQ